MSNRYEASANEIKIDYFHWLCEKVCIDSGEDSYWILAQILHNTNFEYILPMDENRVIDGVILRDRFVDESFYSDYSCLVDPENCSVLEMLIGLAKRMSYLVDDLELPVENIAGCFWELIENLGLVKYTDGNWYKLFGDHEVPLILKRWMDRKFARDGDGSIFPLKNTKKDQRKVDIWYQMQEYLGQK